MIFFDQFKVPTVKIGKSFVEFMNPLAGVWQISICYDYLSHYHAKMFWQSKCVEIYEYGYTP